jgi:hypothetical protein
VFAAVAALPEADRGLLLLLSWEGLSVTWAARVLGCQRDAARERLHRARRRLAAELTAREATSGDATAGETPSGGATPTRALRPTTCRRSRHPVVVTPDEALAALRGVRPDDPPDDVASPASPAARTILQEVPSMTLTDRPDAGREADAPDDSPFFELRPTHGPTGRHRRRCPLVAAAGGVAPAALAGTLIVEGGDAIGAGDHQTAVQDVTSSNGRSRTLATDDPDARPAFSAWAS